MKNRLKSFACIDAYCRSASCHFYIGPVITVGEMNIGIITGFALAALLVVYSVFFNKINALFGKICSVKRVKLPFRL